MCQCCNKCCKNKIYREVSRLTYTEYIERNRITEVYYGGKIYNNIQELIDYLAGDKPIENIFGVSESTYKMLADGGVFYEKTEHVKDSYTIIISDEVLTYIENIKKNFVEVISNE